jgi:hypothetical protein
MNERIKELAVQVYGSAATAQEIKFAELIVQECANQVDWILAEGGKTQGDLIRKHFGVEE